MSLARIRYTFTDARSFSLSNVCPVPFSFFLFNKFVYFSVFCFFTRAVYSLDIGPAIFRRFLQLPRIFRIELT